MEKQMELCTACCFLWLKPILLKFSAIRIPSGAICVGFRANSCFDFKLKTHSTVGFIEHELIFTAYCRDNLFRRRYKGGSFASAHKLDAGEVRKAPRHNLSA